MDKYQDFIADFFRKNDKLRNKKGVLPDLTGAVAVTGNIGLGDSLSLSFIPSLSKGKIKVWSMNRFFMEMRPIIKDYNDYYFQFNNGMKVAQTELMQGMFDMGGGHYFQRLQRAFKLPVQTKPKPLLTTVPTPKKNRVALNLNVGKMAAQQKQTIHPRARELYEQNKTALQYFIFDKLSQGWEFVEFGTEFSRLEGVENRTGLPILQTMEELKNCEFAVCVPSGFQHITAALDIKTIVIMNFPSAHQMVLPAVKDYKILDHDWNEPQHVYLHQDDESLLVPEFSAYNLEKAFAGEVYPFWDDKYLDLAQYE